MFPTWGPAAEAELEYRREGARRALGAEGRRWLRPRRRRATAETANRIEIRARQIGRALEAVRRHAPRADAAVGRDLRPGGMTGRTA